MTDECPVEPDRESELTRLERHQTDAGLDVDADDLLGRGRGDFLDVHAAGGARHHHRLASCAIEDEAQVQLAVHPQPFLDQHTAYDTTLGSGLVSDEGHADHRGGDLPRLLRRFRQLDPATLAPAAGVNLRLDDHDVSAEPRRNLGRFSSG